MSGVQGSRCLAEIVYMGIRIPGLAIMCRDPTLLEMESYEFRSRRGPISFAARVFHSF